MKKKFILPLITGTALVMASAFTIVDSTGIANYSGSPVDGGSPGGTCASCHSGGSTTPTISVTASPAFGTGNTYVAGQTYTINVAASGSYTKYGFNCEIINSQSTSTSAVTTFGTFGAAVTTNCKIFTASQNAPYPACASHNTPSGTSNAATFSFKWTAPASGTGYLYCVGNGVNNNGQDNGDKVSAVTTMTLIPASTTGIASHAENVNGFTVFPNPATDNLRITYTLRERGNVSVKLYNLNGELVADLLNETQDMGIQNNDARLPAGLAKGLYMVKLNVNGQLSTQKLMVY